MATRSISDAVNAPENVSLSEALYEAGAVSARLRAEEFRAEDLDGILDGVSSTGNLNFAILQAGLSDAALAADDDGVSINSIGVDGSELAGRQGGLGDVAQEFAGDLSTAASFSAAHALSGAQGGPLYVDDIFNGKSANGGAPAGSSFSAQFSAAPMGAAISGLGSDQASETPQEGASPEGDDAAAPEPVAPPQNGGDAAPPVQGPNPDGGEPPAGSGGGLPDLIDDILGEGGLIDDVVNAIDPVLEPVLEGVGDLLGAVGDLTGEIVAPVDAVLEGTIAIVEETLQDVGDAVTEILSSATGPLDLLQGNALNAVDAVVDDLVASAGGLSESLLGVVEDLSDALTGNVFGAVDAALDNASGLTAPATSLLGGALDLAADGVADRLNLIADITDAAAAPVQETISDVADQLGGVLGGVSEASGDIAKLLGDASGNATGGVDDAVSDILNSVGDAANETLDDALSAVNGIATDAAAPVAETVTDAVDDAVDTVTDVSDGLLSNILSGDGGDPLIEIDAGLSLNGGSLGGDTAEDGEGSLLDVNLDTFLETGNIDGDNDLEEALDGSLAEIAVGGEEATDLVDGIQQLLDESDIDVDGAGDFDGVDADALLAPLEDAITEVQDELDALEAGGDLSLQIAGDGAAELIGDIVLGGGADIAGGADGADLPDPDAVLFEGLPLIDEGLAGLGGSIGGLFG